ncbi:MAG: S41 family peptidase [Saprospiraceae bacterium]
MQIRFLILLWICLSGQVTVAQTTVDFLVQNVPAGQMDSVGIRGDQAPLSWQKSLPLQRTQNGFKLSINFPATATKLQFKFVLFNNDQEVIWETTENRILVLNQKKLSTKHQWDVEQSVDLSTLGKLSVAQLQADYALVETMVLQVHPGTYRYNDEASIQKELAILKAKFQHPLTYGETYLALSKLTAQLQCDHTKVGFNNQNRTINSIIHYQKDKLPFTFKWFGQRMVVEYDVSTKNTLTRGTEILSINQVPVATIQKMMFPYIAADGATDENRICKMEVDGFDFRYNAFDIFYPLLFPLNGDQLQLTTKAFEEAESKNITVQTITRSERTKRLHKKYPDFPKNRDELWHFEINENNVGILRLNSFGLKGWKAMTIDYKKFLAEAFQTLQTQKVKQLILDIRKNTGGMDEMKKELFRYFPIDTTTAQRITREGRTRFKSFPENLKAYVETWGNPWYYELNPDHTDTTNGYYIFYEKNPPYKNHQAAKFVFQGDIYLLTSANNTSLAFYLAQDFRQNQLGTSIGQPTGGNLRGINGGNILFFRLPNSAIEIDVPIMGGFTKKKRANQGVPVDIKTQTNLNDFRNAVDKEMQEALKKIAQDK